MDEYNLWDVINIPQIQVTVEALAKVVILVKTGIQFLGQTPDLLDSRLRGNDGHWIYNFLQETPVFNK